MLRGSIDGGFRNPPVRWLMLAAPFTAGAGIYVFYAAQPYLLQLYGDPKAYSIAGLAAAIVAGVADRGRADGALDRATLPAAGPMRCIVGGVVGIVLLALLGLSPGFVVALVLLALWASSSPSPGRCGRPS